MGAHRGESVSAFRKYLKSPTIHAFEPTPKSCEYIRKSISPERLVLNMCGVGASSDILKLKVFDKSDLNSFNDPVHGNWGAVTEEIEVPMCTLDNYCLDIQHVDLLKIDVQGFEEGVLRGASNLLKNQKIDLIYIEVSLSAIYRDQTSLSRVLDYLNSNNYHLSSMYRFHHRGIKAGWTDALFVSSRFADSWQRK